MQRRHISPPPVSPCWPPACNIQPSFCGRQWQWQWQCRQQTAMPLQPCVLCACPAGLARRQPQCACCRCWQQLLTRSRTICMQHGGLRRQQLQPMRTSALRRALLPLALHGWSGNRAAAGRCACSAQCSLGAAHSQLPLRPALPNISLHRSPHEDPFSSPADTFGHRRPRAVQVS